MVSALSGKSPPVVLLSVEFPPSVKRAEYTAKEFRTRSAGDLGNKSLNLIHKNSLARSFYIRLFPSSLFALRTHLNNSPVPLLFPPRGLGLIWSAKSACTTAILWYLSVAGFLEEALAYDSWPHKYREKVLPEIARYQEWLMNTDPRKLAWVRVIRDPYRRAISSFRHALQWANLYSQDLKLDPAQDGLSFDSFLSRLENSDIANCEIHFRQQHHPLEQAIRPAWVINADRRPLLQALLDLATPTTDARRRLEDEISRISSFHHARRRLNHGDVSKNPFSIPYTSQDWPEYENFLNASTRRKIERIYAADFSAYADFL